MYICVCRGCLDKYISAAIWPPQTKIPSLAPSHVSHLNKLISHCVYICSFRMLFLVFHFSLYLWLIFVNPFPDPFIRTYINCKNFYHVTEVLAHQKISMQHYPHSLECWPPYYRLECWPPYNSYNFYTYLVAYIGHLMYLVVVYGFLCMIVFFFFYLNLMLRIKIPLNNLIYQGLCM